MRKDLVDRKVDRHAARRAADHRMARRRPRLDDRPDRDRVRRHARPGHARLARGQHAGRAPDAAVDVRHLRLPPERARIRGDAHARRRGRARRRGARQHLRRDRRSGAPGRQAIRKARREHPDARIVVSGCAAQIDPARFAAMAEVDLVLGNAEKLDAGELRRPTSASADTPRVARQRHHVGDARPPAT